MFEVKYYKDTTYLSQSWQLYAEAGVYALERIYGTAPTFRAEKSKTSRHLSEFWMVETEAAWMDLYEIIELAKDELKYNGKPTMFDNISKRTGMTPEQIAREMTRRADLLKVLAKKDITSFQEFNKVINDYYKDADAVCKKWGIK